MVESLLRGIARDGKDEEWRRKHLVAPDPDRPRPLLGSPAALVGCFIEDGSMRRAGAAALLRHLEGRLEPGRRGSDLQVETTLGGLTDALESDCT